MAPPIAVLRACLHLLLRSIMPTVVSATSSGLKEREEVRDLELLSPPTALATGTARMQDRPPEDESGRCHRHHAEEGYRLAHARVVEDD